MIQLTNQIAVVGDLHLGNQPYNDIWQKIPLEYAEWLKSNLVKHNIKTIIFLGDIFNNREELSVLTLHLANEFFKILKDFNIILITGNHDIFYKNRNDINSVNILNEWENITVVNKETVITYNNRKIAFCPWQTDLKQIEKCDLMFGHFDIKTFRINNHIINNDGYEPQHILEKSKKTLTGHFHSNQERKYEQGDIIYTGCAFPLNWSDINSQKVFYIIDLTNLNTISVTNNISPQFIKLSLSELVKNKDLKKSIANNFIKLIIDMPNITSDKIDKLYLSLITHNPKNLSIEYKNDINEESIDITYDKDTFNFKECLEQYIKDLNIENAKEVIKYIGNLFDNIQQETKEKLNE